MAALVSVRPRGRFKKSNARPDDPVPTSNAGRARSAVPTVRGFAYTAGMDHTTPRQTHDLGGVSSFMCRAVETDGHALSDFDRDVDALRQILGAKRIMSVDELRRGVESIPEADYHRLSYYERWIRSIADNLLRSGTVTEGELAAALATAHDEDEQRPGSGLA